MRTLLLAAGYGTRLRPLTNIIPKCLVPIKGKPLLEIWLERLTQVGLGPFLINTHYLSKQVECFIYKSKYRNQVQLVYEPELLGTSGTLVKNLDFFQEQDGLLIHADNYCLADFKEFIKTHRERPMECLLTMMTFRTKTPEFCGIVEIDERGVVQAFYEKAKLPPGNLANGAIYVLSKKLIEIMRFEPSNGSNFSTSILPKLLGRILSYETDAQFLDIGTPETYAEINR